MTYKIEPEPRVRLETDTVNSTSTSDVAVRPEAEAAFRASLENSLENLADDLAIALEVRARRASDSGDRVTLEEFMREQGYDPADFGLE